MKTKGKLKQEIKDAVTDVFSFSIQVVLPLFLIFILIIFIVFLGENYSTFYYLLFFPLMFVLSVISIIIGNRSVRGM